jgi:hypothetical protein
MAVNKHSGLANFDISGVVPVRAGAKYRDIIKYRSQAEQDKLDKSSELMADIVKAPVNFAGDLIAHTVAPIASQFYDEDLMKSGDEKFAIRQEAGKMFNKIPNTLTADEIRFYEQRTGNKIEQSSFEEGWSSLFGFFLDPGVQASKKIREGTRTTDLPKWDAASVLLLPLEGWVGGFAAKGARATPELIQAAKAAKNIENSLGSKATIGDIINNPELLMKHEDDLQIIKKYTSEDPGVKSDGPGVKVDIEFPITGQSTSFIKEVDTANTLQTKGSKVDAAKQPTGPKVDAVIQNPKKYNEVESYIKNNPDKIKNKSMAQIILDSGVKSAADDRGTYSAVRQPFREDSKILMEKYNIKDKRQNADNPNYIPVRLDTYREIQSRYFNQQKLPTLDDYAKEAGVTNKQARSDINTYNKNIEKGNIKYGKDKIVYRSEKTALNRDDIAEAYLRHAPDNDSLKIELQSAINKEGGDLDKALLNNPTLKEKFKVWEKNNNFQIKDIYSKEKYNLDIQGSKRLGNEGKRLTGEHYVIDGLFRSSNRPNTGFQNKREYGDYFLKNLDPSWKKTYADEIVKYDKLSAERKDMDTRIKKMVNDAIKKNPEAFKGITAKDFELQILHDYPLAIDTKDFQGVGGLAESARIGFVNTNFGVQLPIEKELIRIRDAINVRGFETLEESKRLVAINEKLKKYGVQSVIKILGRGEAFGVAKRPTSLQLMETAKKIINDIITKNTKTYKRRKNQKFDTPAIPFYIEDAPSIPKNIYGKEYAEGGDVRGYEDGDQVMAEENQEPRAPNQDSMLSKIGNFFIPSAEAFPLKQVFKPIMDWMMVGNAPKIITNIQKSQQKVLPNPKAPRQTEKRYNVYGPEGNKVFQAKSYDEANVKALQLGNLEDARFRIEEVEVPIKFKKQTTGTQLAVTLTPDAAIGSGTNRLYYSRLAQAMNSPTGNLTIKGQDVSRDTVAMPAKEWNDYFRSLGIRESELEDAYIRQYLNKKGGFNNETRQFTKDTAITYDEMAELVASSPSNFIQTSKYSDSAGTLKYGDSGRHENYLNGTREERVLWMDSTDIRGDTGDLPLHIKAYEGHGNMRQVTDDVGFAAKNKLAGKPYVIGWSLNSDRMGTAATGKKIIVNVADEIQSDFLQKAASKKSDIKAQIRQYLDDRRNLPNRDASLQDLKKQLDNVFRPMPATVSEIQGQLEMLIKADEVLDKVSKMELDKITPTLFREMDQSASIRDEALNIINSRIDDVDPEKMFPNIPFKNQKDWVDALIKNDVYEAARKRFYFDENGAIQINKDAPSHYAVAPAKAVKAADPRSGIQLPPGDPRRQGKHVAYDMQYGGPKAIDHLGNHYTSNSEESLRRIAKTKNSDISIGTVDFGNAGEKVETFLLELTPEMLTPYTQYFKDGGIVQKKSTYNPLLSINDILRPIGV